MASWDIDKDHDGHNKPGWRIYIESYDHIDGDYSAICAVKPVLHLVWEIN